jgi:hypothetical protein
VEFTLTYRGPLRANGGPADKQHIRRVIHRQMKVLWQQLPLSDTAKYLVDGPPAEGTIALIQHIGGFRVAPLVSPQLALVAELTITFLRPEEPGSLITQGGDIDNRLKTLLDALRMPKVINELPPKEVPQEGEDPFFCLLEDDNLVTKLAVNTDRLLEIVNDRSEVILIIHVQIKGTRGIWANIGLT